MTALWWIRRDMRLEDNPALVAASRAGRVVPVFINDAMLRGLGAAPKWRLGQGIAHLNQTLGGHIVFRSGAPVEVLSTLAKEVGATQIHYSRAYDGASIARDTQVKTELKAQGLSVTSHPGALLYEPPAISTKTGGYYKVYTPYWRAVKDVPLRELAPKVEVTWASAPSERLEDWALGAEMRRGAAVMEPHMLIGAQAAQARLTAFISERMEHYGEGRDFPAKPLTSGLSEPLTYGEISPLQIWRAVEPLWQQGAPGAEKFLKELVWREFAAHLYFHEPHMHAAPHRPEWADFPWKSEGPTWTAWQQGRTGIPIIDAGLRELYVTGKMHNRVRMIAGSYLTKHMLMDWRLGLSWFADCLTDWDPASNALGWQWIAGCGPDAAPYFRVFNPQTQAEKFDKEERYIKHWVAELSSAPSKDALSYFDAVPRAWGLSPDRRYNTPIVDLAEGRKRALSAYESFKNP